MSTFLDKRVTNNGREGHTGLGDSINLEKLAAKEATKLDTALLTTVNTNIAAAIEATKNTRITEETYNASPNDYRILVNQTSLEAITINLPTAVGITGKTYFIEAITFTDPVTITVDGIELINGDTKIVLNAQYEYVEVVAANDQWYIVNSNYTTP